MAGGSSKRLLASRQVHAGIAATIVAAAFSCCWSCWQWALRKPSLQPLQLQVPIILLLLILSLSPYVSNVRCALAVLAGSCKAMMTCNLAFNWKDIQIHDRYTCEWAI